MALSFMFISLLFSGGHSFSLRMGVDPVLAKAFPRDFKNIPFGTDYGEGNDGKLNREAEDRRITFLENELMSYLMEAAATKQRPMFTTALIAGDAVILDALAKADLLAKVPVVFVDTFTLFPESIAHLREGNIDLLSYQMSDCLIAKCLRHGDCGDGDRLID